jgi:four helix bundle protein
MRISEQYYGLMQSFTDLKAWQTGMELVEEIYSLTRKLPKEEQYGLTAQLRRSVTSIVANVAEGFSRFTYADKANKYVIARGECGETKAFLLIALRLKFVSAPESRKAFQLVEQAGRLISGLIKSSKVRRNLAHSPIL